VTLFANRKRLQALSTFLTLTVIVLAARVWFGNMEWQSGIRLDVALLALALASMSRGARFGMISGFLIGLLVDAPSPGWMGASSVGFVLVGYFSGSFGQTMYVDKTSARGLLVLGSVVIFDLIFGLLTVGIATPFISHALSTIGSALLTGAAVAALSWAHRYLSATDKAEPNFAADA
jgi:rod shape-determining protein MreD